MPSTRSARQRVMSRCGAPAKPDAPGLDRPRPGLDRAGHSASGGAVEALVSTISAVSAENLDTSVPGSPVCRPAPGRGAPAEPEALGLAPPPRPASAFMADLSATDALGSATN